MGVGRVGEGEGIEGEGDYLAGELEWEKVRETALGFVRAKKEDGRWETGWKGDTEGVATWDLREGREIEP